MNLEMGIANNGNPQKSGTGNWNRNSAEIEIPKKGNSELKKSEFRDIHRAREQEQQ